MKEERSSCAGKSVSSFPITRPKKSMVQGQTFSIRHVGPCFDGHITRYDPFVLSACSFAGFYYVAVTEATEEAGSTMTGYYYHPHSEP